MEDLDLEGNTDRSLNLGFISTGEPYGKKGGLTLSLWRGPDDDDPLSDDW